MEEKKSITELMREADEALRKREEELRGQGHDILPQGGRVPGRSVAATLRDGVRELESREARVNASERPPRQAEQHVGSVFGDRPMAMYTPGGRSGREAVTYPRSGLWIAGGIVLILTVIFLAIIFLWH